MIPWPFVQGGPFWPWLIAISFGLTAWGAAQGRATVPALVLACYLLHRALPFVAPDGWLEVASCTLWLCFCIVMAYLGGGVPAFFYTLSAITYPIFLIFGVRISYMGLSPIVAEVFALLALLSIGGGLAGVVPHSVGDLPRSDDSPLAASDTVARR